eukprot:Skav221119  [mRNA]  locus=scaffold233:306656:308001:- [translate_table: standard]
MKVFEAQPAIAIKQDGKYQMQGSILEGQLVMFVTVTLTFALATGLQSSDGQSSSKDLRLQHSVEGLGVLIPPLTRKIGPGPGHPSSTQFASSQVLDALVAGPSFQRGAGRIEGDEGEATVAEADEDCDELMK